MSAIPHSSKPVPGCTCPGCETERRHRRANHKAGKLGYPAAIRGAELIAARQLLTALMRRGMTPRIMTAQCGVDECTLYDTANGHRGAGRPVTYIHRDTYNRIMTLRWEETTDGDGTRVDPTGTVRKIQGLATRGFTLAFQAAWVGMPRQSYCYLTSDSRRHRLVMYSTARKIDAMYRKLAEADPLHHGVTPLGVKRALTLARQRGFIPLSCWDPDTIDDPRAIAQWTGACGTPAGYAIHYRDHILPVCDPCRDANKAGREARAALKAAP